jgi:hypothetical protein
MALTRLFTAHAETYRRISEITGLYGAGFSGYVPNTGYDYTGDVGYALSTSSACCGETFSSVADMLTSFYFQNASSSQSSYILVWESTLGYDYVLWNKTAEELELWINGTKEDTISKVDAGFLTNETWQQVGAVFHANATTGWISIYLDGVKILEFTGNTGTGFTGLFGPGCVTNYQGWASGTGLDDFYADSSDVELSDANPSGKRFMRARPNSDGSDSDWIGSDGNQVSNYQLVDDTAAPSESDYVGIDSASQRDGYNIGNFAAFPTGYSPVNVQVYIFAKKSNAAVDSQIQAYTYDGATYDDATAQSLTVDFNAYYYDFPLQPDGTDWDLASFNDIEIGVLSAGTF